MANYTVEEIQAFLDYEEDEATAGEMYSELHAEAWMNARAFGQDRPGADALPQADHFQVAVPDGYAVFQTYYDDFFSDGWNESVWDLMSPQQYVFQVMVDVDRKAAADHYAEKAEAEARAHVADWTRDPDWDEWIEPPF